MHNPVHRFRVVDVWPGELVGWRFTRRAAARLARRLARHASPYLRHRYEVYPR